MQNPEGSQSIKPATAKRTQRQVANKGTPPAQGDTLGALNSKRALSERKDKKKPEIKTSPEKQRTEPLNFRVTPEFRRAFKRASATEDCKKVELLERIFVEWNERNPPDEVHSSS